MHINSYSRTSGICEFYHWLWSCFLLSLNHATGAPRRREQRAKRACLPRLMNTPK